MDFDQDFVATMSALQIYLQHSMVVKNMIAVYPLSCYRQQRHVTRLNNKVGDYSIKDSPHN